MDILSEATRCGRALPGLLTRIDGAACIAFDLTDGLLTRRCRDRAGLIAWLEARHSVPGFARARAKAEWLARRRFPATKAEPVTLAEIYTILGEILPEPTVTPEMEAEADARFLTSDPTALRLLGAARERGKRVIGVDRSGLPRANLGAILSREGIALDAIYTTEDLRNEAEMEPNALPIGPDTADGITLAPLRQVLAESPPAFLTHRSENAYAALVAGHTALRLNSLPPLGLFGYTLGGPLQIGIERAQTGMQGFLVPSGVADAFTPMLTKAQDLLALLEPDLPDAAALSDIDEGIAAFREDIAWIAQELTADGLRLYCQEQLSRLLLAPRPEERRLLDTVPLPDGARAGRALAPTHETVETPDLDLLRLNQTFRDLLPKELVRLAESGELAGTDWRDALRRNPFKPSLWAALQRYRKRIEKRLQSRAAER